MKRNQLKIGSFLSYLQMGLAVAVGLLYTPVMLRLLGKSEYGLYNTVASTISMLSILSLGFNSSYIRYYSIYKKENRTEDIYKLNGLFMMIFSIIGVVALVCGLFLSFHLDLVFKDGLTKDEYAIARTLMLLLTANLSISFPMSVFSNIISAHERFIFLKILGMVKTVLGPLVTLPLLLAGYRSIAMVSVTVSIAVLTDIAYAFYTLVILKNKFVFRAFELGIFKSLFVYTVFIAVNMIIDQINWNIDKLLLGRFKGTTAVAVYSVGYALYHYYQMFSTAISGVFSPRIHKIVNSTKNDLEVQKKQLTDLMIRVGRIQFFVLGLIASGIVFFGKFFIVGIWAGEGYDEAYYVALLLILPASIALIQNIGIEVQRAENRHQFRSIAYLFMAVINLALSIILCQKYGPIGSAIGTAISLVLANGIVINIYYHKKCNVDIIAFWKSILRAAVGIVIPILFGIIVVPRFGVSSKLTFLTGVAIYSILYCVSVWLLGMNQYEKGLVMKPVQKLISKCRRKQLKG